MGYVYALCAALLFGANGSVTKVILGAGIEPAQLTLFRVGGTALIAAIVLLFANRNAFRVTWRQLSILVALGIVGVALLQFAYAVAIQVLPVGITLLIEYTAVLIVATVAYFFFHEKVRARLWVAIGLVLIGLAVVAQIWASELVPFGVLMAFAAAVCLATYFLVGEREVGKTSPMAVAFWTMGSATVFWLVFSGWWRIDPELFTTSVSLSGNLAPFELPLIVPILWNVLLGSFLPFLLSLFALKYLTATAAGIVASAEVIFAFLFAWLWLGEGLNSLQVVGAAVVLVGIILAQTARMNKVVDADLAIAAESADALV
ncbi:drug/metabolite transporter (DMT)-like permease [Cryobacterium mesophilum]|uniref:DMT family transporter n=1 Tax=Terrimesophilobacter mesophilus TaxID=433647 RepID=A0A4R8VB10_9MICO|nr:DMT family transporter [Terrimesophilobacter mesophilus]MBB5632384.1 drug/metabolite transporter (DMT)-like permease [Terrimesophilobacter mesophilus]TFB79222.1 DMT family transporter [Terrimesophilobacter mesophilus]